MKITRRYREFQIHDNDTCCLCATGNNDLSINLLPSGLYRRLRNYTESVHAAKKCSRLAGSALPHPVNKTIPPVGNFTLPRRSLQISMPQEHRACKGNNPFVTIRNTARNWKVYLLCKFFAASGAKLPTH